MKKLLVLSLVMISGLLALDCGPKVMVPPRIDLKRHEVIGIVDFRFTSKGQLGTFSTRKFTEIIRRDQGIVRIIELGPENDILKKVGYDRFSQAAFKDLGKEHKINTVITGELVVSDVRPNVSIMPGLDFISLSAEVDATLTVQMVETATGASIWSTSASDTRRVGNISIFGGKDFDFSADDPEKAYGKLVNNLIGEVTKDFRATWEHK
jgi:hypothetical protein